MSRTRVRSDFDFGPYEDEYRGFGEQEEQARGPLILVLALGVLLIFAGVVWNTYRQGVRPAEGGLPVFADEKAEFKRAPDERGGSQVAGLERGFYELMETESEERTFRAELDGAAPETAIEESVSREVEQEPSTDDAPIRVAALSTEAPDALAASEADIEPSLTLPAVRFRADGTFQVQLMALRSETAAQNAWREFNRSYPRLASGAFVDIQRADLGARGVFYRLRLGAFNSRDEARNYCDELKSNGRDCMVVSRQS